MEYNSNNKLSFSSANESIDRSDSESMNSNADEERIRQLFFTCDTDGDGFITSDDIRQVCAQLDIDYCVEDIMEELGTDANGRISYTEFVKRRSELLQMKPSDTSEDCESTASESKEPLLDQSSQASSFEMSSMTEDQAFGSQPSRSSMNPIENRGIWGQRAVTAIDTESTNAETWLKRNDSWEFDSGTHDLEFDFISLHKLIQSSGIDVPHNINELLDLANKYYIDSINSIKQDKCRIQNQLKAILDEKQILQKQTILLKEEKIKVIKDLEMKKLREQKTYEEKIIELQSMISELSQNLNYYHFLTIKEEEDESYEQENDNSLKKASDLNAIKDFQCPEEYNFESNLNYGNDIVSKDISKKIPNELVVSEIEKKVNMNGIDWKESADSHASALQIDRLESRIRNLEAQIDLSALNLHQSNERQQRLKQLLTKYEANNNALQMALNYSDKALDITELLVVLLETEIGLVLANCRAAGLGRNDDLTEDAEKEEVVRIYELATQRRREAEDSALNYLREICPELEISTESFSRNHENQLKDVLSRIKEEKAIVSNSISDLESSVQHLEMECNSNIRDMTSNVDNVILIQDLVSIRKTNSELRSQILSLEKENTILSQQIKEKVKNKNKNDSNDSEAKKRDSEVNEESDPLVLDLKKANEDLNSELEKVKRKYSTKVKKLEHKIASMNQKNNAQVKILQNKISMMEDDGSYRKCIETTL